MTNVVRACASKCLFLLLKSARRLFRGAALGGFSLASAPEACGEKGRKGQAPPSSRGGREAASGWRPGSRCDEKAGGKRELRNLTGNLSLSERVVAVLKIIGLGLCIHRTCRALHVDKSLSLEWVVTFKRASTHALPLACSENSVARNRKGGLSRVSLLPLSTSQSPARHIE